MATEPDPSGTALLDEDATGNGVVAPAVVAVVVTHDPGPRLEETLHSLRAQDYPGLTTLVLDARSEVDVTQRVADAHPEAYFRRVDSDGFAAAANEAIRAVEGATYLLLCHDDVVFDDGAVRALVEEAYRSNAGICGPKFVAADNPRILLEVGMAIDRFGSAHSGIEPGEVDQEQHDAVRDVFYVSDAAMLVRADLFSGVGGFDEAAFPGAEDLDLCWRARLRGARVLVAPDARVGHHLARDVAAREDRDHDLRAERNRVRTVLKCYSRATLAFVLPVAWCFAALEITVFTLLGRRARVPGIVRAWLGAPSLLRSVRPARAEVQAHRVVADAELRELQSRGSARFRGFLDGHLRIEERIEALGRNGDRGRRAERNPVLTPVVVTTVALVVAFVVGVRHLVTDGVAAVGSLVAWESTGTLFDVFTSAWRESGLGSTVPASPGFGLLGTASALLFGEVGLARTLLVVLAVPIGAWGAYRLVRDVLGRGGVARAGALVYLINPMFRNAIAEGRLGALVFAAGFPFLLAIALEAAGWSQQDAPNRRRSQVLGGVLLAVCVAFLPAAAPLVIVALLAVLLGDVAAGGATGRRAHLVSTGASMLVVAAVLVGAWLVGTILAGGGGAAFGFVFREPLDLDSVARFATGPAGAGWVGWLLLFAAAVPLLAATGTRWQWAVRGWFLAVAGFACTWVPSLDASIPRPAPEASLVLAALGLTIAIAAGVATLRDELTRARFGWRHVATLAAFVALVGPVFGFVLDAGNGRFGQPSRDWAGALSWMPTDSPDEFRVLWLGDASVLPVDPVARAGGVDWALTRNAPSDPDALLPAPARHAEERLGDALAATASGETNRLGRVLASAGVRYVVVVDRPAPGAEPVVEVPRDLGAGVAEQLDLADLGAGEGARVYENEAWFPIRSVVPGDAPAALEGGDAALASSVSAIGAPPGAPVPPGTLLWAEAFDPAWAARSDEGDLGHRQTSGWANGYDVSTDGEVDVTFTRSWSGPLLALAQGALWLFALGFLVKPIVMPRIERVRSRRGPSIDLASEEHSDTPSGGGSAADEALVAGSPTDGRATS